VSSIAAIACDEAPREVKSLEALAESTVVGAAGAAGAGAGARTGAGAGARAGAGAEALAGAKAGAAVAALTDAEGCAGDDAWNRFIASSCSCSLVLVAELD